MIKVLMKSIKGYVKPSILSMVFITLEVVLECSLPFITSMLVDQMNDKNITKLVILSLLLVVIAMLSLLCGSLAGILCSKASAGFAKNLRRDMYENITKFSFSNIDRFQASSLVTRMTTDVTNVQMAYMMIIRTAIRSPLMIAFSIIMSFIMAPQLAWIFVVVMPFLAFALLLIMYFAMKIFRRIFKKYDELNDSIKENIDGIRVVKSYVREDYETKKFDKAAFELKKNFTKAERIIALNAPAMQFAVNSLMILLLIIGSIFIIKNSDYLGLDNDGFKTYLFHEVSVGQFQSLTTYGFQSLMALMMFSMVIVMIVMAIESGKRIAEVLIEKPDLVNPLNPVMEIEDGSIEFKNVSFKYSKEAEKYALEDINLSIKSGETIGIIGGTGSSKTTLINLISRLYDTTLGDVLVGGKNVKEYDLEVLRNNVAVVLQKNLLFSGTIESNLRWGNENATMDEIKHAAHLACADEFIESFPEKYETHIEQGGSNVSGGQKQRLCIARALLKNPKILILDDSTSAVDTKTDSIIRKGFKEFIPTTTKIIIAQRISSVEDADKIIVMDNGCISAIGTHQELLNSNEIYKEVYYSQNKVGDNNA
ncbi:MAG: ABC transporter ATP-binding protein/permease [Acholeplasmatales bacterium]|nr:ABC transporter ATP-binding protein/permease [Acholeplasmatales bacterium]